MKMSGRGLFVVLLLLLFAATAPGAGAQTFLDVDPTAAELSRDELVRVLERLEEAASAPGYSRRLRTQAAREAAQVRSRLEEGDFRVGDRVVLEVAGEPQLSDTLTVTARRSIELPQVGDIPLSGVLRSELEAHLREQLSQYLREPRVRARALVRVAVLGEVGRPGFYTLPASVLLEDALMTAGGPAGGADLAGISIQRGNETLWGGDVLQRAMIEGRTLDQLNVRAGDRIVVPRRKPGLFEGGILRTLLVTLPPLVYLVQRLTR